MRACPAGPTSDSEEQDTAVVSKVSGHWPMTREGKRVAAIATVGVVLVLAAPLIMMPSPRADNFTRATSANKLAPHLTVLELLESDELRMAVERACIQLAQIASRFQPPEHDFPLNIGRRVAKARQLTFGETNRLRMEAALGLRASLEQLLKLYPEIGDMLRGVNITGAQGALVLSMLQSFTDERVFDLGMEIGRAIFDSANHSRNPASILRRLQRQANKHAPELRRLREQLIPASLRNLRDDIKQLHVKLLRKKGFFHVQSRIADWRADFAISQSRRLHSQAEYSAGVSADHGSSTPLPPFASTSKPGVTNLLSKSGNRIARPKLLNPPTWVTRHVVPINWFTIGAPATSALLGLTLLTTAALLPGRGGFPRHNPAQYGIWGVQGAATLGECLSNLGFERGVIYFAPCMIDVMFFGFDVVWVFFDGLPHNFPEQDIHCAPYSEWPALESSICGNCLALVPTQPYGGKCKKYCESFDHKCVFAAEEVDDRCLPLSRYGCDEEVAETDDMLCQCKQDKPIQAGTCAPYSQWPNIYNHVCGHCTAFVNFNELVYSCSEYCESFGHRCIDVPEETDNVTCQEAAPVGCGASEFDEEFCTCARDEPQQAEQPCDWYSKWPQIVERPCGNCEAVVPANGPVLGIKFSTCDAFCKSFGHECVRAIDDSLCSFNEKEKRSLACDEEATYRFQICQCVLPGRAALLFQGRSLPAV